MSDADEQKAELDAEAKAAFRDMAELWLQAQPSLMLFLSAVIWDSHAVDDVHQDVARVVTERFSSFDRTRPFSPWVIGIARNCVANYLRENKRNPYIRDDQLIAQIAEDIPRVEPLLEERKIALAKCIDSLRGTAKRIVRLRYFNEMDMDSVAKEVGLTRNAMEVALHRARNMLGDCIERKLSHMR